MWFFEIQVSIGKIKIKTAVNILKVKKNKGVAALTDVKNILETYNYNRGIRFINRLLEEDGKSWCRPNT